MPRWLIAALLVGGGTARADAPADPPPAGASTPAPPPAAPAPPPTDAPAEPTPPAPAGPATAATATPTAETVTTATDLNDEVGDQGLGAELGIATGGRVTPGGLRISGHYYYQMSSDDWFDGAATFTFGGGGAACFRDRSDAEVCEHGFADGGGLEIAANVRRLLPPQGKFRPFARVGIGVEYVRFSADDVSGIAFPFHLGGGVRATVAKSVAVIAQGQLDVGFGAFNHRLGMQPLLGVVLTAGAEFRLR